MVALRAVVVGKGEKRDLATYVPEQARSRENYYQARNEKMDLWYTMYLLIDEIQNRKPYNVERFSTNLPMSGVDRSVEILTRNPLRWHVVFDKERTAERDLMRRLELYGTGVFRDVNQLMVERYEMEVEQQAAWYGLVRGWMINEIILTEESGRQDSPLWFNMWDPRYVYPRRSTNGLRDVVYALDVTLDELWEDYPDAEVRLDDPESTVRKYIWYDADNYVVMADYVPKTSSRTRERESTILYSVKHGLSRIPVVIVPCAGIPVRSDAQATETGTWYDANNTSGTRRGSNVALPRSWTAHQGRSIFAGVEQTVPQFNEFMAVLFQAIKLYAFPTVKLFSADGTLRKANIGTGIANALSVRRNEDMQFMQVGAPPPGIEGALGVLTGEQGRGMVPPALLDQTQATSGFHMAQAVNVALNALGPWARGENRWQEQNVQQAIRQQVETGISLTLRGRYAQSRTFFEETFDPVEIQRMYYIEAERTPALPDDILMRAQIAQVLLNPARPIASLQTVYDQVLNWPDPDGEQSRIFGDMANSHPAIIAERLETALIEQGMPELAGIAHNEKVLAQLVQSMKMGQAAMAAKTIQGGGVGGPMGAQPVSPSSSPPEQGNPMSESGRQSGQMPGGLM